MAELLDSNLYVDGRILNFKNGDRLLVRSRIDHTPSRKDRIHALKDNEDLTEIAWRYYRGKVENPERYWWVIADANDITNPLDLGDRERLLIPDIFEIVTDTAL